MRKVHTVLLALFSMHLFGAALGATEYQVYYLGGQSNMDGYGLVSQLPDPLREGLADVPIFHGNSSPDRVPVDGKGKWTPLRPGHGVGFTANDKEVRYSDRFGIELAFAQRLKELLPDQKFALIKYSRGGTSIGVSAAGNFGCWEPDFGQGDGSGKGTNQYDHCLAAIRHAFSDRDIDGDGTDDQLVPAGIVWMQGESDATVAQEAESYEANLKRLMDLIRAALRVDDLPVVIGRISDSGKDADGRVWDFGDRVRQAQADFVAHDGAAALVTTTDGYQYSDPWHYDSAGYIDLGRNFAAAMVELKSGGGRD
jgi:iduronate 2-sulfatase